MPIFKKAPEFKVTISGPRAALWSLICYPLALACCIVGGFLYLNKQPHQAVGMVVLGIYMYLAQIIWSSLAVRDRGQKLPAGDIGFLVTCACGSVCVFALIFGTFSDAASYWLLIGSTVSILISQHVAKLCEAIATRSLRPFYDQN